MAAKRTGLPVITGCEFCKMCPTAGRRMSSFALEFTDLVNSTGGMRTGGRFASGGMAHRIILASTSFALISTLSSAFCLFSNIGTSNGISGHSSVGLHRKFRRNARKFTAGFALTGTGTSTCCCGGNGGITVPISMNAIGAGTGFMAGTGAGAET